MAGQIFWVVEGIRCLYVYEVCVFGVLVGVGEFLVSDLSTNGLISSLYQRLRTQIISQR